MPTYEYRCDSCEHRFDIFQSIKAGALRKCPECGKLKLRRLISTGGGVIFKGSGFYETDYRSASYKKQAEKEKGKGESQKKEKSDEGKPAGGEGKADKKADSSETKGSKKDK